MQAQSEAAIVVAHLRKVRRAKRAGNKSIAKHGNGKEAAILRLDEARTAIAAKVTKVQVWFFETQQRLGRRLIQTRHPGFKQQAIQTRQYDDAGK